MAVNQEELVSKQKTSFRVIDCDVHNTVNSVNDLMEYLDDSWKDFVRSTKMVLPVGGHNFFIPTYGGYMNDSKPAEGTRAGGTVEQVQRELMDKYNVDYGILSPQFLLSWLPQDRFATAVSKAYNNWMIDKWLSKDSRFKGQVNIAASDPIEAAKEIDRVGHHPDIVQVGLSIHSPYRGFGDQFYDPIWEAAVRNNLVCSFHVSVGGGLFSLNSTGAPKNFPEFQTNHALTFQAQMTSMIFGGVFDKFPDLKVVFIEGGFSWVPHVMYTMDTHWTAARREVPWVKRYPSEYVREHFWFGTQPIIKAPPKNLLEIVQMIGEDRLVYASDYPHWEFDSPATALNKLPRDVQQKILYDNSAKLFGFPL